LALALRDGALAFALAMEPLALLVVNIPGSAPGPDLLLLVKLHDIRSVDSQENHYNCCHQMSDFAAKMHQIQFRLGLCWGAYCAPTDLLAGFNGAYF